jgi:hypothetical protein
MSRVEKLYDLVGGNTPTIVYVDPAGVPGVNCDFTNIPAAAAYLRALPEQRGGIIAIKGGVVYSINGVVDLRGLTIKGVGGGWPLPIIDALTGGVLQIGGTVFDGVVIRVTAGFAGTYFVDVFDSGPNNFLACDFQPAAGKFIFGSSTGLTSTILGFFECGQSNQNGNMIDVAAVFPSLTIDVIGTSLLGMMKFGARTIITNGEGRADSTAMASIPNAVFVVGPGENIQARLNALAVLGGGVCHLLPGLYTVTTSVVLLGSNIILKGSGESTVIRAAAPWTGGATGWDGVVMIGRKSTATIVNECMVRDMKVEQPLNLNIIPGDGRGLHAFVGYGGHDNSFEECVAEAQANLSYYITGHVTTGFIHTDSVAAPVIRPKIEHCIVKSNGVGVNKFSDAFHVEALLYGAPPPYYTCYGHGNRAIEPVMECNKAEMFMETFLIFTGTDGGTMMNNVSKDCPFGPLGAPIAMMGCTDCTAIGNNMLNVPAPGAGSICFYLDGAIRCICIGNVIDGGVNAFQWGFLLNYSNFYAPGIRNSWNIISHNVMRRCNVGIELTDPLMLQNVIGPNVYDPATVPIRLIDPTTSTQYSSVNMKGTGNPNGALSGNFGDCFFDTATNTMYKCTSWPQGTTWQVI